LLHVRETATAEAGRGALPAASVGEYRSVTIALTYANQVQPKAMEVHALKQYDSVARLIFNWFFGMYMLEK
jgi:hypothetical protein